MNLEGLTEKWTKQRVKYYENASGEIVAKVCTRCSEVKVVEEYSKGKKGIGGKTSACRSCQSEINRKYRDEKRGGPTKRKRVKLEERNGVIGKECMHCNRWYALEGYFKQKDGLGGRTSSCHACNAGIKLNWYHANKEHARKYREANKERRAEICSKWREENRERKAETARIYYKANKERHYENNRKWRESNKELLPVYRRKWREKNADYLRRYRQENKERYNGYSRKWRRANPDKVAMKEQRRRARKARLPDDFTTDQQVEVLASFNNTCALTGDTNWTWDHAVPINSGHGGTTVGNLYPLRGDLNSSKSDSNIFEWFEANRQRFELSQERFDNLIAWLASANAMTVEEYRDYVYWCHENPRSIDELKDAKEVI